MVERTVNYVGRGGGGYPPPKTENRDFFKFRQFKMIKRFLTLFDLFTSKNKLVQMNIFLIKYQTWIEKNTHVCLQTILYYTLFYLN